MSIRSLPMPMIMPFLRIRAVSQRIYPRMQEMGSGLDKIKAGKNKGRQKCQPDIDVDCASSAQKKPLPRWRNMPRSTWR